MSKSTTLNPKILNNGKRALPSGWRWAKLGEVCEINPPRPNLDRAVDTPTTFVPMSAVDERAGIINKALVKPYAEVRRGYTYFVEGDVLFAKITPCMQNGKHIIARGLIDGIGFGSTEFHVLHPRSDITADWIHFYIRQPSVLLAATAYFTGAVGQQRVPEGFLVSLEIPLPPLAEQRYITAILNDQMRTVEQVRAAAEAQLEAAKALPTAYLRATFSNREAKQWPIKQLGEVCEIRLGKMLSPASKVGVRSRPYLRNVNVQWNRIDFTDVAQMDFTEEEENKFALRSGDLLVCEGGEPGRAAVWNGQITPCCYQKALHRLRPINGAVDPIFVMYRLWMGAMQGEFLESHAQTTIAHLPAIRLSKLQIAVPSIGEQKRIVASLSEQMTSADRILRTLEEQLNTIDELPAALLRRGFNGEL